MAYSYRIKRNGEETMSQLPIPYGQHQLDEDDISAVVAILRSNIITQGNAVEQFGKALADYTGAKHGVAVSSGTAALHIAIASLNIGPDDEVITCPITFCATPNSVLYQGGKVVFVDIDENTLNIDSQLIEEKITPKTKAVIPIDFRGHPAPLIEIKEIADKHGLAVIEDGAHSIGSCYFFGEKKYMCGDGVHSDICIFSFHPVKHITTGEGGAILTNNKKLHHKMFLLKKHGIDRREDMFSEKERKGRWVYDMELLGFNYRITDFQAALGLSQLKKLDKIMKRRRDIVKYYNERFVKFNELIIPYEATNVNSNFHLYVLQVNEKAKFDRYDLFTYLQKINYRPMVHYIPVHLLKYYKERFGYKRGDFPKAERYYDRSISIPLYPSLTDSQVEKVVEDISSFIIKKQG